MPSGILDITSSAKSPAEQYKNVWHQIGGKICGNQRKLWKQAVLRRIQGSSGKVSTLFQTEQLYYRTQKNGLCSDETAGRI